MAIDHLRAAVASGDDAALLRYARLHLGDGDENAGRAEIDKAYVVAIRSLIESPPTDYPFVRETLASHDLATLAHLFLYLHLHLVKHSGSWIHDGDL